MLTTLVLLPFMGFLINGGLHLAGKKSGSQQSRVSANLAGTIGTGAIFGSFLIAVIQFLNLHHGTESIRELVFDWFSLGAVQVPFALRFDALSGLYCLFITGIGALIHLYSIGYMAHDATPARYFAYLNLFCVMMLVLVLGENLPMVFMGWEGVGLCSYLLIGYWHEDSKKVEAGMKAFVMNRIGDLGFILAMAYALTQVQTLNLSEIASAEWTAPAATLFGLLLFFAATGKSAQIPLFTWLPDAMAGPTPVSALIHAATMVTSGIYLMARMAPVVSESVIAMQVVAWVGATTALVTATMATAQSDIKKILAYSTVSQLGLMFLAVGVGAFDTAVFHVVTHAFFKALMFLGAGSVIHALHEEQNVFKMGGLFRKISVTAVTFMMGWLAIIGTPLFSGFFSKDEILVKTLVSPMGGWPLFVMGLATSALTAFYMTRLFTLVFLSPSRMDAKTEKSVHESPVIMTLPLILLSVLSVVGGAIGIPGASWIEHWLSGIAPHIGEVPTHTQEYAVMGGSTLIAFVFAGIAYRKYRAWKHPAEQSSAFLVRAWGWDAFYLRWFGEGTQQVADVVGQGVETSLVQRLIRWVGYAVDLFASLLRSFQTGSPQFYLVLMVFVLALVASQFFSQLMQQLAFQGGLHGNF